MDEGSFIAAATAITIFKPTLPRSYSLQNLISEAAFKGQGCTSVLKYHFS